MKRLEGKVALITGAGSGIGRAGAIRFAEEGAKVVIADLSGTAGDEVAGSIVNSGGSASAVQTDVTDPDSVAAAVQFTISTFGGLDICYSNAGGSSKNDGPITEIDLAEWHRVIAVDLYGTFLVCRAAIKAIVANRSPGTIVTTASIAGLYGSNQNAYSAAKGGVLALSRSIAKSYKDAGIRVNTIVPGFVETERVTKLLAANASPENEKTRAASVVQPSDVAEAAVYLASDESKALTGTALVVDQGITSLGPRGLL
jgi:NAD(P)-dependent dehydrogenase (short-subunit alcohol dehydrogenase family)